MGFKAASCLLISFLAAAVAVYDDFGDIQRNIIQPRVRKTFKIHSKVHRQLDEANCQFAEIKKCNNKFKETFHQAPTRVTPTGDKYARYCQGLQTFMACLEGSSCTGPFIGNYSYVVLQHGMMDKVLNVCPQHQFKRLKTKVKAKIVNQDFIEDVNEDEPHDCSLRVHTSCVDLFTQNMETNSNMCQDVEKFITCYEVSSKFCRSIITQQFARLCAKLGEQMLKANKIHKGMMC